MIKKIILIIILILGFFGCTSKEEIEELEETKGMVPSVPKVEEILQKSKAEIKEISPIFYTYCSYGKRDPFVPLDKETYTAKEEYKEKGKITLNLKNIFLIGVIKDKKGSMALLCDDKENGYVLKQGLLYDDKDNELKGIKGIIRKDCVVLEQNKKLHTIALSSYVKKEEKSSGDIQEDKQEESIKEEW